MFIAALFGGMTTLAALRATRPWAKAGFINVTVMIFVLAGAEAYFYEMYFAEEPPREVEYRLIGEPSGRNGVIESFDYHETLGYAYHKMPGFSEVTRHKGNLLYEVSYFLGDHGLRIGPPFNADPTVTPPCLLFFGDSFTFGEGVRDEETLPYRVGLRSNNRYQVYNFGFLGYGPHQMLAQVQHGLVKKAIRCTPRHAIYQALPSHVSRAAGLEAWDQAGPKYVVDKDGTLIARGHFNDEPQPGLHAALRRIHQRLPYDVKRSLEKSALYRGVLYMRRPIETADIALFTGIVNESRRILEKQYPGITFHILFWDFSHATDPIEIKTIEALSSTGIPLHLISSVLPDYSQHRERYILHPADGHPNMFAYDLLAKYISETIVMHP
ncbi:MAG: hypothetical protein ABW047_05055 [Nitrospiraceae bacterium]